MNTYALLRAISRQSDGSGDIIRGVQNVFRYVKCYIHSVRNMCCISWKRTHHKQKYENKKITQFKCNKYIWIFKTAKTIFTSIYHVYRTDFFSKGDRV